MSTERRRTRTRNQAVPIYLSGSARAALYYFELNSSGAIFAHIRDTERKLGYISQAARNLTHNKPVSRTS